MHIVCICTNMYTYTLNTHGQTYMLPCTLTSVSSLVYNKTIMRIVRPGDNVTMTREALSAVTAGRRLIGWGLFSPQTRPF